MAVKHDATTKLVIKVATGTTESGKPQYGSRTFQHIAPELADDDAYAIGTALGALQAHPVSAVSRLDSANLAGE